MAMAIDNRQQSQLSSLGYDQMRYQAPQFTNPWVSGSTTPSTQLYSSTLAPTSAAADQQQQPSQPHHTPHHHHHHQQQQQQQQHQQPQAQQQQQQSPTPHQQDHQIGRPSQVSIPSFPGLAVTSAPAIGAGTSLSDTSYGAQNLLDVSQDPLHSSRSFSGAGYSAASPNASSYAPTSAPHYAVEYAHSSRSPFGFQDPARRSSHPLSNQAQRDSFSDAVDASRGMLSLSQTDITPRNIYGNQASSRGSTDSYGFPSTHSTASSISSASTYPSYYNGSVSESVTDYSSASESVGDMGSRTLPRPSALIGTNLPPAPQTMMGQFSSKVASSSQKKHKCKICDKRFTRPSSLQTHMYSHTGEKPFACEVEGCGRHFSVVSNLRRHRKVHKGERDHPSPDDDDM